jgi:hypothetical protein
MRPHLEHPLLLRSDSLHACMQSPLGTASSCESSQQNSCRTLAHLCRKHSISINIVVADWGDASVRQGSARAETRNHLHPAACNRG